MGKLFDLTSAIAAKLEANVPSLADIDVLAYRGRDVSNHLQVALQKTAGLAVLVGLSSGEDVQEDQRLKMGPRQNTQISVTIFATPALLSSGSPDAPLTTRAREVDDVLESIMQYLHNLDVFDVGSLEGGLGTLRVSRWAQIESAPPVHAVEIQCEILVQIPEFPAVTTQRLSAERSGKLLSDESGDPLNAD